MKKRTWKTIATEMQCTLAALAMTAIVACDKDDDNIDPGWTTDFSPVEIYIEPVDASGNNLMAEMKDKKITAEWRGVIFEKDSLEGICKRAKIKNPYHVGGTKAGDSAFV